MLLSMRKEILKVVTLLKHGPWPSVLCNQNTYSYCEAADLQVYEANGRRKCKPRPCHNRSTRLLSYGRT